MTTPVREAQTRSEDVPYPPIRYAWYVVGVLTLVYVFSFIDRQILSLLVRPIRRDLGISDTQMSLLMGFTFALFYTVFGIPLGRLADHRSRRTVIAAGFAAWSLFTAACGLAQTFMHMLLARIGVGVGEAALSPAAYSLITDYFPPERRSTALGVYGAGIYLGSGLAYLLGGLVIGLASTQETYQLPILGATRPWQLIFYVVGLPGLALALLLYTVREPVRRGVRAGASQVPFRDVVAYVRVNWRTFACHNFGIAFCSFTTYAAGAWIPTFLIRKFGWNASQAGIVYGVIVMTAGVAGITWGGRWADRMRARGRLDGNMRVALYVALMTLPVKAALYLVPESSWAIVLLVPTVFLSSAPFGVAPAAIQQMMPNPMRGQASAVYLFVNNLVGLGLGPTAVALVTDYVYHNDAAIDRGLLIVTVVGLTLSATLLYLGLKPFLRSLERLKEWSAANA